MNPHERPQFFTRLVSNATLWGLNFKQLWLETDDPEASDNEIRRKANSWGLSGNGVKNYSKRARWSRNR